jgi:hypothetical protein
VADIVVLGGPLPAAIRHLMDLWAGCISGALTEGEYREKLTSAGFTGVDFTVLRTYGLADIPESLRYLAPSDLALDDTQIVSAFMKATKADV